MSEERTQSWDSYPGHKCVFRSRKVTDTHFSSDQFHEPSKYQWRTPKYPKYPKTEFNALKQGSTRHIYVFHDDPEVVVEWYMAIRSAKLNLLHVAHPSLAEAEVKSHLIAL